MNTVTALEQVFCNNFVAYFRSHVTHVNIIGRNFASDHALLGSIYENLQEHIDTTGELLRTLQASMPDALQDVIDTSDISVSANTGTSTDMLAGVRDDLALLRSTHEELMDIAETEGHKEIANYCQDRILTLNKFIWQLDATLEL
jgi:DNA-binding ferritin-like protein